MTIRVCLGSLLLVAAGLGGCSEADEGTQPPRGRTGDCLAGQRDFCDCGEGERSGTQVCEGATWGACGCSDNFGGTFGNAQDPAGGGGGTGDGGTAAARPKLDNCDPGSYVGTYTCPLEMGGMDTGWLLEGAVAFDLAIDESTTAAECGVGEEFCFDLVIAEGSGTIFGFVNLFIGFEGTLEGGLDCTTGEFHAQAHDGIWGIPVASDPTDPMSPATVGQPPSGMWDGGLDGLHLGGNPQVIEGDWDLMETTFNYRCPGPFTVERQP